MGETYLNKKSSSRRNFFANVLGENALDQNGQSFRLGLYSQLFCLFVDFDVGGHFSVFVVLILDLGAELIVRVVDAVGELIRSSSSSSSSPVGIPSETRENSSTLGRGENTY